MRFRDMRLPPRETLDDEARLVRARALAERLHTWRAVRDFAPTPVPRAIIEHCLRQRLDRALSNRPWCVWKM